MIGYYKSKLSKCSHEEENDQRIRQCHKECCKTIVEQRTFVAAYVYSVLRIAFETVHSEYKKQDTTENLEYEFILLVVDKVHYETHSEACDECVDNIADAGTDSRNEAVPPTFIHGSLNAEHTNRSHWCRCYNTNEHAFDDKVNYVYVK